MLQPMRDDYSFRLNICYLQGARGWPVRCVKSSFYSDRSNKDIIRSARNSKHPFAPYRYISPVISFLLDLSRLSLWFHFALPRPSSRIPKKVRLDYFSRSTQIPIESIIFSGCPTSISRHNSRKPFNWTIVRRNSITGWHGMTGHR